MSLRQFYEGLRTCPESFAYVEALKTEIEHANRKGHKSLTFDKTPETTAVVDEFVTSGFRLEHVRDNYVLSWN